MKIKINSGNNIGFQGIIGLLANNKRLIDAEYKISKQNNDI